MRAGIKTLIISVIIGLAASSCQAPNRAGLAPSKPLKVRESSLSQMDKEVLHKRVNNWNDLYFEEGAVSLDTFLRLTEDYLQAVEVLHKDEMEDYEERLSFYEKGQISAKPQLPAQDYTLLIKRLNTLKDRFQYSKTADAIYYLLGYALYEQGKRDEAVKVFEELIKSYPQSDYRMEASFRAGESYFETGQMAEAVEAYGRMLNFPRSVFYEKALYKLGWAYYKVNDFKRAIDTFLVIMDRKVENGDNESTLKEEALFGVAQAMSRFKDMNQAVEHLKSKGVKDYTYAILTRLADFFSEEGRYESALPVLTHLAESFPDLPSRPFIYEKMGLIYDRMGNEKQAAIVMKELMDKHNPDTLWYKKNCAEGKCEKIDELVSNTVLNILKAQHLRGKKEDNADVLTGVAKGCRQLIVYYPKSQNLKVVNLLLAEALFDAKMYADAVKEYEQAARLYPQGRERGEIAYYSILTYEILFLKAEKGKEKIIDSVKQVVETYKNDLRESEKLDKALFKLSDIYAQGGLYNMARETLSLLLEGGTPLLAYQKMAELALLEKNPAAAEGLYVKIVEMSDEPTYKEELARIRYDIAEGQLKEGKQEEAVAMYNRAFTTYPKSRVGEASLLKMSSIYVKAGDRRKIKDAAKLMFLIFPDSVNTISLLVESGYAIWKEDPKAAARFYEDALSVIAALNKKGRVSFDARKLILSTSGLYEDSKDYNKVEELLTKYLEIVKPGMEEEAEIRLKLANAQFMTKKKAKGFENLKKILDMEGSADIGFVAKARLMLAKDKQESYLTVKLTQPFEETLKKKSDLLEDLITDYSQITKYKILELQAEAFFQMGVVFENFKDSILQAERPADLSKEELSEYTFLLEEKAYPYEDQAVKAYEKSLKTGRMYRGSREWVENSITRLAAQKPALYKREFLKGKKGELFLIEPEPASLGDSL